jgi:3-phenylpropionate/cinnamic acid dioxygenase small subunit
MAKSLGSRMAALMKLSGVTLAVALITASAFTSHVRAAEKLSVEERLDRLEAADIIRWKLQDYMRLLNSADWDNYIKLFAPDAKLDIVEGILTGREAIKTRMANATARMAKAREGQPRRQTAHILSNIKVMVTGPDTAAAQSRFTMLGEDADGHFMVTGSGYYTDQWVKENGEWMIGYRAVHWDMLHGQKADAAAKEVAATRKTELEAMDNKLKP